MLAPLEVAVLWEKLFYVGCPVFFPTCISPIHVGRRFRKFALKSRFIQNFELRKNNWSLQINGWISKSRFTKISQSRFIFAKVALFKILNYGGLIGHCR